MICCVCKRDWPDSKGRTLVLTDAEKQHMESLGIEAPDTFLYCGPCWRVLSDKMLGAQFIKGSLQMQLRAQGVPNAEELGQRYMEKLLALKPKS